jgi:hypothetical protein
MHSINFFYFYLFCSFHVDAAGIAIISVANSF